MAPVRWLAQPAFAIRRVIRLGVEGFEQVDEPKEEKRNGSADGDWNRLAAI